MPKIIKEYGLQPITKIPEGAKTLNFNTNAELRDFLNKVNESKKTSNDQYDALLQNINKANSILKLSELSSKKTSSNQNITSVLNVGSPITIHGSTSLGAFFTMQTCAAGETIQKIDGVWTRLSKFCDVTGLINSNPTVNIETWNSQITTPFNMTGTDEDGNEVLRKNINYTLQFSGYYIISVAGTPTGSQSMSGGSGCFQCTGGVSDVTFAEFRITYL
ncbi:hypothetical protein [Pedobacter borealis]|uniref:hypothetical protein n=1 Tax=Pedobacter borealis TaxID=475254 RepID=UPI0012FA0FA4|nr:hypothetical protein [Pedobacter borealis]